MKWNMHTLRLIDISPNVAAVCHYGMFEYLWNKATVQMFICRLETNEPMINTLKMNHGIINTSL